MSGWIFAAFVVIYIFCLANGSCDVAPDLAIRALKRDGVSNITLKGHAYGQCPRSDSFSIEFEGDKNGEHVVGCICATLSAGPFMVRYK
jgi:hypothetical protein